MSEAAVPSKKTTEPAAYIPPGFRTLTPYLIVKGASQLLDSLKSAFGATERIRVPLPDGLLMHAEVALGNCMIELADSSAQIPPAPQAIHLYLPDCDAAYASAIAAGAASIYPPADQPWGDRQGAVKDSFGNRWYIAKAGSWDPGPDGVLTVQPFFHLKNADKMVPFAEAALGAQALGVAKSPEGLVLHATIKIGNSTFEIDEASAESQAMPCHLHMYVPNADAAYSRALGAGATSVDPPTDKPYGERSASVKDPFGNIWYLATYLGEGTQASHA